MEFIRTPIKKLNSVGEKELLIFSYVFFYIFQVIYLRNSYEVPVLLIVAGVKAMISLAGFSIGVDNLQNAFNSEINRDLRLSSLFMATVYSVVALSVLLWTSW